MGLFEAALIYSDGVITPVISVLSALEGLNVAISVFKAAHRADVIVLAGLFAIQGRGTVKMRRRLDLLQDGQRLASGRRHSG